MKCPNCGKKMSHFGTIGQLNVFDTTEDSWGCLKCRVLYQEITTELEEDEDWFDELFEEVEE